MGGVTRKGKFATLSIIWYCMHLMVLLIQVEVSLAQLPLVEVFPAQLPLVEVSLAQLPLDEVTFAQLPQHLGVQPDARTSANGISSAPLKRLL